MASMDRDTLEAAARVAASAFCDSASEQWQAACKIIESRIFALSQQAGDGWIPVTERVPEQGGMYLALREGDAVSELCAHIFDAGHWRFADGSDMDALVTHWMPIPVLPTNTAAGSGGRPLPRTDSDIPSEEEWYPESPAAEHCQSTVPQDAAPQVPVSASAGEDDLISSTPAVAATLTLPEEPHRWHFVGYLCRYKDGVFQDQKEHSMARSDLSEPVVLWGDYDALRKVAEQAIERMEAAEALEKLSVRDGNFLDKLGCCKVCDGEIPDGHTDACDIWKIEKKHRDFIANEYNEVLLARDKAEGKVAALTEAYAAACIRLQTLGEKTVPLSEAAAQGGKEGK